MGRAVFADADRVVSENVDVGKLGQRAEPNGSAAVIGKHREGRTRSAEQPVIRDAIENRAHAVLANAEPDVAAAGIVAIKIAAVLDVIHCRSMQVGAAAHEQRHRLRNRLQYFAASFARGQFRILRKLRNLCKESDGNFSLEPVIEQLRFVRTFLAPLVVSSFPAVIIGKQLLFVLGKVAIHIL